MRTRLEQRLATLQQELETGRRMLAELDAKRENLQSTMLRIEGAAHVLQETLQEMAQDAPEVAAAPTAAG